MSLVREQSIFLSHVADLIKKASELGFLTSGGELYRTTEQQALHVKNGRSTTMNSQHLKRLAVDINFFVPAPDGDLKLTYDVEDLRPLGEFWEALDEANRWGGNWSSFKDTPHFERQDAKAVRSQLTTPSKDSFTSLTAVGAMARSSAKGIIKEAVGPHCPNVRDDVETIQRLLNIALIKEVFSLDDGRLKTDGAFGPKTLGAITTFQEAVASEPTASGIIDPESHSMSKLLESLPDHLDSELLSLIFLRSSDDDIQKLSPVIIEVMAARDINSPLRCAHFLAQIGHESGELHFREEIASGQDYEGRNDLGNNQPGDGRKFKGRGLIQLTGRANYAAYGRAMNREGEILSTPGIVASDDYLCVDVAGWFWARRALNPLADADDLTTITRKINGKLNGFEDRKRLLIRAKALLRI